MLERQRTRVSFRFVDFARRRQRGPAPRHLADLFRLLATVSLVSGTLLFPIETAVRLSLLLIVLFAARLMRLPAGFDATFCGVMLSATWIGAEGWYGKLAWLAPVAHTTTPGLVAVAVVLFLTSRGMLDLSAQSKLVRVTTTVFLVFAFGLAAAALWEIYEWRAFELFWGNTITTGYQDTMEDLVAGGVGALVAGLALAAGTVPSNVRHAEVAPGQGGSAARDR